MRNCLTGLNMADDYSIRARYSMWSSCQAINVAETSISIILVDLRKKFYLGELIQKRFIKASGENNWKKVNNKRYWVFLWQATVSLCFGGKIYWYWNLWIMVELLDHKSSWKMLEVGKGCVGAHNDLGILRESLQIEFWTVWYPASNSSVSTHWHGVI